MGATPPRPRPERRAAAAAPPDRTPGARPSRAFRPPRPLRERVGVRGPTLAGRQAFEGARAASRGAWGEPPTSSKLRAGVRGIGGERRSCRDARPSVTSSDGRAPSPQHSPPGEGAGFEGARAPLARIRGKRLRGNPAAHRAQPPAPQQSPRRPEWIVEGGCGVGSPPLGLQGKRVGPRCRGPTCNQQWRRACPRGAGCRSRLKVSSHAGSTRGRQRRRRSRGSRAPAPSAAHWTRS